MEIPKFLLKEFIRNPDPFKHGGEAYIFKGTHPLLTGEVAIKRWSKSCDDNEVKLLIQSMNHKNIIEFLGILVEDQSESTIGYIMPYMSIGSLEDVIHNKNNDYDKNIYTSEQVTSWITQICLGLSYLHSKNIIHRDIKPDNVLLGKSYDDVKLSDFGVSRSLENITHNLTKGVGTPVYMAPEMSKTENYNISVDIYALSITIWEILHRRVPFDHLQAQNSSVFELFNIIFNGERPELGSDLSKGIFKLLNKCWHADVCERPKINDVLEFSKNTGFRVLEKETVLLLGGFDGSKPLDSLLVLQTHVENEETWKKINIKLPYRVRFHGAQFLKNNLYIFGGQNPEEETLNSTYKLSNRLKWEKMVDMNEIREGISNSNVILNDRIWVLGGFNGKERLRSVEIYDPSINEWKYMKEMNECRGDATAAVVSGKIFCCGGWDGHISLNSTECYDPSSDVWTFIAPMPLSLRGLGAVAMDGNLIVIGGCNSTGESRSVWSLEISNTNAEWIEKSSMSLPRRYFSIAKIDDKIFVCGGESEEDVIDDVEILYEEIWRNGPKLPTPRRNAAAIIITKKFAEYLK